MRPIIHPSFLPPAVADPVRGWLALCRGVFAGWDFIRVVEEQLVSVEIVDHQKPITPRTVLGRNTLGFELFSQRVQSSNLLLHRDVEGDEYQALARLLRPRIREDESAARPFDLRNMRFSILIVAPGAGESKLVNVKAQGSFNVCYMENGTREPVCHEAGILPIGSLCADAPLKLGMSVAGASKEEQVAIGIGDDKGSSAPWFSLQRLLESNS